VGAASTDEMSGTRSNANAVAPPGPEVIITGPTVDGEALRIVARIDDDGLHVSNVVL